MPNYAGEIAPSPAPAIIVRGVSVPVMKLPPALAKRAPQPIPTVVRRQAISRVAVSAPTGRAFITAPPGGTPASRQFVPTGPPVDLTHISTSGPATAMVAAAAAAPASSFPTIAAITGGGTVAGESVIQRFGLDFATLSLMESGAKKLLAGDVSSLTAPEVGALAGAGVGAYFGGISGAEVGGQLGAAAGIGVRVITYAAQKLGITPASLYNRIVGQPSPTAPGFQPSAAPASQPSAAPGFQPTLTPAASCNGNCPTPSAAPAGQGDCSTQDSPIGNLARQLVNCPTFQKELADNFELQPQLGGGSKLVPKEETCLCCDSVGDFTAYVRSGGAAPGSCVLTKGAPAVASNPVLSE
jgi:hypothetical protein